MINKNMNFAAAVALLGAAVAAHAQYVRPAYSFPSAPVAGGPANVQVADTPFYVTPVIGGAFGHDDNLFLSHTNERASNLYILSPGGRSMRATRTRSSTSTTTPRSAATRRAATTTTSTRRRAAQFDMAIDPHNFLRLGFDYIRGHDPRGSTDRPSRISPTATAQSQSACDLRATARPAPGAASRSTTTTRAANT